MRASDHAKLSWREKLIKLLALFTLTFKVNIEKVKQINLLVVLASNYSY